MAVYIDTGIQKVIKQKFLLILHVLTTKCDKVIYTICSIVKTYAKYVEPRGFWVILNGKSSKDSTINKCLPQGSMLVSILLNIYSNDMPKNNSKEIPLWRPPRSLLLDKIFGHSLLNINWRNDFSEWLL